MKKLFIFLLLTLAVGTLFGQNYLVVSKKDAFHLTAQLTSAKSSTIIGIAPGFTINGRLSFYFGIGKESGPLVENSRVLKPSVSCLVIKQGDNNAAISVGLNASYQHNKFRSRDALHAETISLGPSLHHEIGVSEGVQLIPSILVAWNRFSIVREGIRSFDIKNTLGYGLLFTVKLNTFYVEPSLLFNDRAAAFNLQFGLVFPKLAPS